MKRGEVNHKGRYVAKVGGERTIVKAYQVRGSNDLLCRDERTAKTIRLSSRRLWRPALIDEHADSETIHLWEYREQIEMWDGVDVCLPALDCSQPIPAKTVSEEMFDLALNESHRFFAALAGC